MKKHYILILLVLLLVGCAQLESELEDVLDFKYDSILDEKLEPINITYEPPVPKNYTRVHVIDVGQGLSVLYEDKNLTILFDCGKYDDASNYLKSIGIKKIDVLILSHSDFDHSGGCSEIISEFGVTDVIDNGYYKDTKNIQEYLKSASKVNHIALIKDYCFFSNVCVYVAYDAVKDLTHNDRSLVLSYSTEGHTFVNSADCEKKCETEIIRTIPKMKTDYYIVGHHGSKSSSNDNFLEHIDPDYAIISVGATNSYGHPAKEAIDRINKHTDKIMTTSTVGTIVITCENGVCN